MKNIGGIKFCLKTILGWRDDGQYVRADIVLNSDSTKPVYIYYEGQDTGFRGTRIGDAERHLRKLMEEWKANGLSVDEVVLPIDYIEVRGCSAYNRQILREEYGMRRE